VQGEGLCWRQGVLALVNPDTASYTRICTILDPASLTRVGLLYFYLPLVESSYHWAAEVRGEGVLITTE